VLLILAALPICVQLVDVLERSPLPPRLSAHAVSPPSELSSSVNDSSAADVEQRRVLRLGYLTGSQKGPGVLFYDKPGQSISGAITLAVKEINDDPEVKTVLCI
jgi:hypothetical protein